jgi:hypothetical protein
MAIKRKEPVRSVVSISSVKVKLCLYASVAMITSLISDLSHHTDSADGGFHGINEVRATIIFLNVILQGVIAWRAFIDGSVLQEQQDLNRDYQEKTRPKKRKPRIKN